MERDDLYVDESYARAGVHDEEHGKQIRKKIYFVTALLSIITIVEVALGIIASGWVGIKWEIVKYSFIIMTLVKAGYIVLVFMHLGDEKKSLKYVILAPYIVFILYLIFVALTEGGYQYDLLNNIK
jgi:cytochrome c oxidase subunit IV